MENVYSILYVDDETTLLEISKIYLEKEGMFAVDGLTSASEALVRLKNRHYDAIISDYQMPEMDGINFLKTLRTRGDNTPFIIFTGRGREEIVIQALNEGADFYLQKGGEPKSQFAELAHKIHQAVSRKQAEKALTDSEERYRSVVNDQTEMIARFTPDGIITFANGAYRSYFTSLLDLPEVTGKNIRDVMQVSDCAKMEQFISSLTQSNPIREIERVFNGKNGHKHWQVWSVRALFGTGIKPAEYQVVGRDITDRKQTEEELMLLKISVDQAYDEVFWLDFEGRILYVNEAACRTTGYSREELMGMKISSLDPDFSHEIWAHTVTELRERKILLFASRHQHKDGTIIDVEIMASYVRKGDKEYSFAFVRDITERKRTEEELRENELKFRSLVEYALEGILIVDFQGKILFANAAAVRTIEAEGEAAVVGRNMMDFIAPESQPDAMKDFAQVAQGHDAYLAHYTIISAKGNTISVESIGKVITYEGKPADLISLRDITEKKNAEDALRKSEEKYRLLIENSHDIIYTLTPEGIFTFVSPSWTTLLGHPVNQVMGKSFRQFVHPDDSLGCMKILKETIEDETRQQNIEYRVQHADGSWHWHISKSVPLHDETGNIIGFEGIASDITERKRAEERLSEVNNAFLSFSPDPLHNIKILTGLAGKMLQGTCALYNRLETGLLCSLGMWNTPPDFDACDQPEGHICNDIILNGGNTPTIITSLLDSRYAETDPNVRRYQLQTYIGMPVKIGEIYLGSLCIMYQDNYSPSPQDLEVLSFIAQAVAIEDKRRTAMQDLMVSEERFRTILNSMQSGIVIIDAHTHRILDANPKALEMIGSTHESVLGSICHKFICPAEAGKCPVTDLGQNVESSERVLLTRHGETLSIHKSVIKTNLRGKEVLIESFVDISKLKQAEERLRESEEKYRKLVESSSDMIWEVDKNATYSYVSPSVVTLLGYTPEEVIGRKPFDFIIPAEMENIGKVFNECVISLRPMVRLENTNLHKDGHYVVLETSGEPVLDSTGNLLGFRGIDRDVTERNRAEISLRQANKKLNLLSSITRHDIKNQLLALNGFLDILQMKIPDPAYEHYFNRITEAGSRISAMIEFTREYEMIGVTDPVWQDCHSLIDTAAKAAPLGKIGVKNDIPDGMEVFADPLIAKVCYNLMDNAARYGGKITSIRFFEEKRNGNNIIICEDDGNGIAAGDKERIFDRGFGKNTGLGLALSREILDITGITIRENGEPGQGARFEISVPVNQSRYRK